MYQGKSVGAPLNSEGHAAQCTLGAMDMNWILIMKLFSEPSSYFPVPFGVSITKGIKFWCESNAFFILIPFKEI